MEQQLSPATIALISSTYHPPNVIFHTQTNGHFSKVADGLEAACELGEIGVKGVDTLARHDRVDQQHLMSFSIRQKMTVAQKLPIGSTRRVNWAE